MEEPKYSTGTSRSYGQNKQPQHFRLTPEAVRKLEEASKKRGMSKTVYVQLALDAQFNKDGIH
jgi:hypothetical protein